jgi:hypothetical protein
MMREATMMKRTLVALLIVLAACTWAAALTMEPPTVPELPKEIDAILRCDMKPEPGPCKTLFDRYYYDGQANKCRAFFWGGCDGVVPFETMEECEKTCPSPQTLRIKELKSLKDGVYAQVSVEFPKVWKEPAFLLLLPLPAAA